MCDFYFIKRIVNRASFSFLAIFALTGTLVAQPYTPPGNERVDAVLDSGWRFIQQNVSGAQATNFDDSSWTNVNLPHTWDIPDGQSYPSINLLPGHRLVSNSLHGEQQLCRTPFFSEV